jgi:hypothetical protein
MKGLRFTIRRVAAVQRRARPIRSASASAVSSSGCFAAFRVGGVASWPATRSSTVSADAAAQTRIDVVAESTNPHQRCS